MMGEINTLFLISKNQDINYLLQTNAVDRGKASQGKEWRIKRLPK